jgi:hypothetical protein
MQSLASPQKVFSSSGTKSSIVTAGLVSKSTKNSTFKTGQLKKTFDSLGLTDLDMSSLREDIFLDAASSNRSRMATPKKQRLDMKHKYLKKIMKQTREVESNFFHSK